MHLHALMLSMVVQKSNIIGTRIHTTHPYLMPPERECELPVPIKVPNQMTFISGIDTSQRTATEIV